MIAQTRQAVKRHRRKVGFGLGGIGLITLVAVLLDLLGARWISAIQASTTILLLLATGVYAYLTWRLVRATEDPPAVRLAAERAAIENLARSTRPEAIVLGLMASFFPLDFSAGPPPESLFSFNNRLSDWMGSLLPNLIGLPADLRVHGEEAGISTQTAILAISRLERALQQVSSDAGNAAQHWNPENVRKAYEAPRTIQVADVPVPSWDEVVEGRIVNAAAEGLDAFAWELDRFLIRGRP